MHVTFGWGYDGARWSEHNSIGCVVTGPMGFADLLSTRLACGFPLAVQPQSRVVAYLQAMRSRIETDPRRFDWCKESFELDPWHVAQELLGLRDEFVTAGWSVAQAGDAPYRVATLAAIESWFDTEHPLPGGHADQLRTVLTTLRDMRAKVNENDWLLGIETVDVHCGKDLLPSIWQEILDGLVFLGVEVTYFNTSEGSCSLTIFESSDEWDAATIGARILAGWEANGLRHTVIAKYPTDVLDDELARRGVPLIGINSRTNQRPISQLIKIFLTACTEPYDVHAIVDLLSTPIGEETANLDDRLLPAKLCNRLIDALVAEPGVGGEQWRTAIDEASEDATSGRCGIAHDFNDQLALRPIRVDSDGCITKTAIAEHLDWLKKRLSSLPGQGRVTSIATAHIEAVANTVKLVSPDQTTVRQADLNSIIALCCGTARLSSGPDADRYRDVVTTPGQLGLGTSPVLWWLPVEEDTTTQTRCRPDEATFFAGVGVIIPTREQLVRLQLDSGMRALRQRGQVVAVLPTTLDGEYVSRHPLLTLLLTDSLERSTSFEMEEAVTNATLAINAPFDCRKGKWAPDSSRPREADQTPGASRMLEILAGATSDIQHVDCLRMPVLDPVERSLGFDCEHLIPDRVSYSQWEKLLIHPLEWLIQYPLGVRQGRIRRLPSRQQMIGSWIHKAVETIVTPRLIIDDHGQAIPVIISVSVEAARATLEDLSYSYASQLRLDGNDRQLRHLLDRGAESITALFAVLRENGIKVCGAETQIDEHVTLLTLDSGADIMLSGARDLDIELSDGRRGVVDLKYSGSRTRHRRLINDGQALQLAVYAFSIGGHGSGSSADFGTGVGDLSDIPVGYWLLNSGEMVTAAVDLFPCANSANQCFVNPKDTGGEDESALFDKALDGLRNTLERLQGGRIIDIGNLIAMTDSWEKDVKRALDAQDDRPPENPNPISEESWDTLKQSWAGTFVPVSLAKYANCPRLTGAQVDNL